MFSLKLISCSACQRCFDTYNKSFIHFILSHGFTKKNKCIIEDINSTKNNTNLNLGASLINISRTNDCNISSKQKSISRRCTRPPIKMPANETCIDLLSDYRIQTNRDLNSKEYACEACKETFYSSSKFKQHCSRHGIKLPFVCDQCGVRFKNESAMIVHYRSHTKEKPYRCHICGKILRLLPLSLDITVGYPLWMN